MLFSEGKNSELWKKIRTAEQYKDVRETVIKMYGELHDKPIECMRFSDYKIFRRTGSRKESQKTYFEHRSRLSVYAAMSLIFEEDIFIKGLEDIIWAICDEFSWALPAHYEKASNGETYIDLFAAETGFALSEILYLCNGRIDGEVVERVKKEIETRVFDAFEKSTWWWENATHNWAAVCAGSIGATYMYLEPMRFETVRERIGRIMENFLNGYEDDGACKEGIGYWTYGFGFFVYYAALLKEFTDGKEDLFVLDKVKTIARFQEKIYLQDGVIISFSDVNANRFEYSIGLTNYLKSVYKDDFSIPPKNCAARLDRDKGTGCKWTEFIRNIVWDSDAEYTEEIKKETIYFENAQIFIVKKEKYSIAAKGGNNGEPHNHNDIGSFIIASDNKQKIVDFGMGEYTRGYFNEDTRYSLLTTSSRGHSVPIINGQFQKAGKEYKAKLISCSDNSFEIDISNAYGIKTLSKFTRKFNTYDSTVEMTDSYSFSEGPQEITERLVSWTEPKTSKGRIEIDDIICTYSYDELECTYEKEIYKGVGGVDMTAYLIDLKLREPSITGKIKLMCCITDN